MPDLHSAVDRAGVPLNSRQTRVAALILETGNGRLLDAHSLGNFSLREPASMPAINKCVDQRETVSHILSGSHVLSIQIKHAIRLSSNGIEVDHDRRLQRAHGFTLSLLPCSGGSLQPSLIAMGAHRV